MPFCPSCRSEFREGSKTCAECGEALVSQLSPEEPLKGERADIYICYNDQLLLRVVDLLEAVNIEALVRDRGSSSFPTSVGTTSKKLVAVRQEEMTKAKSAIQSAIDDGVIDDSGSLLI